MGAISIRAYVPFPGVGYPPARCNNNGRKGGNPSPSPEESHPFHHRVRHRQQQSPSTSKSRKGPFKAPTRRRKREIQGTMYEERCKRFGLDQTRKGGEAGREDGESRLFSKALYISHTMSRVRRPNMTVTTVLESFFPFLKTRALDRVQIPTLGSSSTSSETEILDVSSQTCRTPCYPGMFSWILMMSCSPSQWPRKKRHQ